MLVVIGLGANLGDRFATMGEAVRRIRERARLLAVSNVYETPPIGGPSQPVFLNAAVAVEWSSDPHALLDVIQQIERDLGRTREVRWGPRTVDLDILWIAGGVRVDTDRLVVPHPRLHERAFAILPLLDVAADAPYSVPNGADEGVVRTRLTLA